MSFKYKIIAAVILGCFLVYLNFSPIGWLIVGLIFNIVINYDEIKSDEMVMVKVNLAKSYMAKILKK